METPSAELKELYKTYMDVVKSTKDKNQEGPYTEEDLLGLSKLFEKDSRDLPAFLTMVLNKIYDLDMKNKMLSRELSKELTSSKSLRFAQSDISKMIDFIFAQNEKKETENTKLHRKISKLQEKIWDLKDKASYLQQEYIILQNTVEREVGFRRNMESLFLSMNPTPSGKIHPQNIPQPVFNNQGLHQIPGSNSNMNQTSSRNSVPKNLQYTDWHDGVTLSYSSSKSSVVEKSSSTSGDKKTGKSEDCNKRTEMHQIEDQKVKERGKLNETSLTEELLKDDYSYELSSSTSKSISKKGSVQQNLDEIIEEGVEGENEELRGLKKSEKEDSGEDHNYEDSIDLT